MFKLLVLALVATAVLTSPSKIERRLASNLSTKGTANILVSMNEKTSTVLSTLYNAKFASRDEQVTTVAESLKAFAKHSQKAVIALLDKENIKHEVFWITNQVYIRNADAVLVKQLAAIENVSGISEEFEIHVDPVIPGTPGPMAEWGVDNVEAEAAWALPGGNNGTGAVVGGIDTGVHSTHVDLASNYVGTAYGWRDVTLLPSATARDNNGHGTHTMGTIAGANGIGVAPGAKWMACQALTAQGSGTNAGLISCGQWMACPTLQNGQSPDCTKAPHVVSNSWGGGQANPFYNEVINAWHAAGIIPVFANGNSGPACQSANSPADSLAGVIGVGASTVTNELAYFSSVGPTLGGRMKPDISAPGLDVRSAWNTGNTAYNSISGTSMACPHVAGVVALLKAHNPQLSFAQVTNILYNNANQEVTGPNQHCGGVNESIFPNHMFGHGIVNARRALSALISGK